MTKYRVTAEQKVSAPNVAKSLIMFVLDSNGYKNAWVDGRNTCRTGNDELKNEAGEDVKVPAGQYTVRSVFTLEKRAGGGKSKVISATDFISAAEKEGLKLNSRLHDFAVKMGVYPATPEPAAAVEGESQAA